MALILALDAATEACSVALSDGERLWSRFEVQPRQHSRLLLPMVDEVLSEAGVSMQSLDAIAVGRGPGSFTGVRIAVATAQGLAFASAVPVVPISNLLAIAANIDLNEGEYCLAAIDARMSEVYWALCQRLDGVLTVIGEERISAMADVEWPSSFAVHAAGTGWQRRSECPQQAALVSCDEQMLPSAEAVLGLAQQRYEQGGAISPERLEPVYLRNQVTG